MPGRNIRVLTAQAFLSDFKLYAPITILYFQQVAGSFSAATTVIAVILLTSTLAEVPTGLFSDRLGRKLTMMISAVLVALYILLLALATSLWLLIAAAIIVGISDALASGNNQALLYESAKQEKNVDFSHTLSRTGTASQVGLGLSAAVGGLLLALGFSMNFLFWLSILPQVLRTVLCFFIKEPRRDNVIQNNIFHDLRTALHLFRQRPRLRLLTLAGSIQFGVGEAAHRFGPAFFATVWPLWAINIFSSLRYAFTAFSFWISGFVIRRLGPLKTLWGGSAAMAFFGIAAVLINNTLSPLLVYMNSFFHGPNSVAREQLMQEHYSDSQRATMGSLSELFSSLLTAVVALLLGFIADKHSPGIAFLTAMMLRLPVLWIYGHLMRRF